MDLYEKVENVIQDHIKEHKAEVRKGKELMSKLDVVRCNQTEVTSKDWEQFWEDVSSDQKIVKCSTHYYDYTRNDLNRLNPFTETPDYTELSK